MVIERARGNSGASEIKIHGPGLWGIGGVPWGGRPHMQWRCSESKQQSVHAQFRVWVDNLKNVQVGAAFRVVCACSPSSLGLPRPYAPCIALPFAQLISTPQQPNFVPGSSFKNVLYRLLLHNFCHPPASPDAFPLCRRGKAAAISFSEEQPAVLLPRNCPGA
jgi:hypothetical protein